MSYRISSCPLTQIHRSPQDDDHFRSSHQQWLSSVEVRGQGCWEREPPPAAETSSCPPLTIYPEVISLETWPASLHYHPALISHFVPPYQTLLTNHPAGHILAALKYLAAEREKEIWSLCSGDGLKEEAPSRCAANVPRARSGIGTLHGVEINGSRQLGRGRLMLTTALVKTRIEGCSFSCSVPTQPPGARAIKLPPGPATRCSSHPGNPETLP